MLRANFTSYGYELTAVKPIKDGTYEAYEDKKLFADASACAAGSL